MREEIDDRLEVKLEEKFESKLKPIRKDLTSLKKDVKYLKKSVDIIVANYDEAGVKPERRIRRIEEHVGLTT